jgi:hypothetical protein
MSINSGEYYYSKVSSMDKGGVCQCNIPSSSDVAYRKKAVSVKPLDSIRQKNLAWYSSLESVIKTGKDNHLVQDVIIHGSFGDFTATKYSDVEITLLLVDSVMSDENKLKKLKTWMKNELNPLLLTIDPLQHHGPFYLWAEFIDYYSEDVLPLDAYKESWSFSPVDIVFSIPLNEGKSSLEHFEVAINSLLNYKKSYFRYGISPYSIKRLLSLFVLLPAIYYKCSGASYSKKEAIANIYTLEIPEISNPLLLATAYRDTWKKPPLWLGWLRGKIGKGRIPSGRLDAVLCSLYKDQDLQERIKHDFLPLIPAYCNAFQEILRENALHK